MRLNSYTTLTAIAALLCALPTRAQGGGDEILSRFESRFARLDSLIFKAPTAAANATSSADILAISRDLQADSLYALAVDARTAAQVGVIDAETGLQATGQVYARIDNMLGLDEDDDPVSVYRAKVQAELRWYFLQSRLYKHAGRVNEARLKADIDILAHEKERIDLTIYRQKELLRWRSDSMLAGVMLHRVENLALLQDAYFYLLSNENISGDELLRIIDERAQAERQLATMGTTFPAAPALGRPEAWTVTVDTTALMSRIEDAQVDLRLLRMRIDLLEQQARNEGWWGTVRIAPFVRYSGYYTAANTVSSNVDAGVSFTIPINNQSSRERTAIRAQKSVLEATAYDVLIQVRDKISYLVQEIDRLNRATLAEAERVEALRLYLSTRTDAYAHRYGEYNRLLRAKEYNSYISSLEKIIEFQYRRDDCIADLQTFLVDGSILEYCRPEPIIWAERRLE